MLQVLIFLSRECRTCTIFTRFVFLPEKKQQPPPPMRLHPKKKKIKRNQIKTNQSNSHGQHKQRDQ